MGLRFSAFEALLGAVRKSTTLKTLYSDEQLTCNASSVARTTHEALDSKRLGQLCKYLRNEAFSLTSLSLGYNGLSDKDVKVHVGIAQPSLAALPSLSRLIYARSHPLPPFPPPCRCLFWRRS